MVEEKIFGFHHICFIKNGKQIFEEQLETLKSSGLYDNTEKIFCSVLGDYENYKFPEKYEIIFESKDMSFYEEKILEYMYNYSNINVGKYWYIHTKGVNDSFTDRNYNVLKWRKYMEYFNIVKWDDCVKGVNYYDVVGVNYSETPEKHFSGNFWWTKSSYVSTNKPDFSSKKRHEHEFWICKKIESNKVFSYHESTVNHYYEPYEEFRYIY